MSTRTRRVARATLYGGAAASLALLFACSLRSDSVTGPGSPNATRTSGTGGTPTRVTEGQTYFEFQVERQATLVTGKNAPPRYPEALRSAGIGGTVLVQFVVDTAGRPDMLTFKVLNSSHDVLTASVRGAVANMTFVPAQVGGRNVKQLIQMPFEFSMTQASNSATNPVVVTARGVTSSTAPNRPAVAQAPLISIVGAPPRGAAATDAPLGIYLESQVTKAVSPRPGNRPPRYPDVLRSANVEGEVLAQFIVDENGLADTASFRVLRSTHDLFSITVREVLPGFRFYPAELNGRPVKQVVQMPFQFSLAK